LDLYLAKNKKRIVGQTYNPTLAGITRFIENLVSSCETLPVSEDYFPLPAGPFHYEGQSNYDPKVRDASLVQYVKQTIDSSNLAGAKRVSGSLSTESTDLLILTSAGARGRDKQSKVLLNVRAFADDDASGHGLSCTSYLSDFEPEKAGASAGDYARRALNPTQLPEGSYNVIFASTVIANILPVAREASAFAIESGVSFLDGKLDQRVGVQTFGVDDHGV